MTKHTFDEGRILASQLFTEAQREATATSIRIAQETAIRLEPTLNRNIDKQLQDYTNFMDQVIES